MNRYKVVKKVLSPSIAGVYKAVTNMGRNVYGYGKNLEDATKNITKGLQWNEQIKTISREEYNGKLH